MSPDITGSDIASGVAALTLISPRQVKATAHATIVDKIFLFICFTFLLFFLFVNFLYFGLQVTLFYCIYVFISITAFTNFVVELCVFKGTNVL